MINKKLLLAALIFAGFISAEICFAALELSYPPLGNIKLSVKPSLVEYLKYIFAFTVLISGLIVFVMMVSSGFKWLTSAGNTSKTAAAREEIFSAFLGMVIVLCSWLILNTINPQLTAFNIAPIQKEGVTVTFANADPNDNQETYSSSVGDLKPINNIDFDPAKIDVYFYREKGWTGERTKAEPSNVNDNPKSMEIIWKTPGIQLCYSQSGKDFCDSYSYDTPSFGTNDNKYTKIKIIDERDQSGKVVTKYVGVVFEEENYKVGGLAIYKNPTSTDSTPAPAGASYYTPPAGTTYYTPPVQQGFSSAATLNLHAEEYTIDSGWASSIKVYTYKPSGDNHGRVDLYSLPNSDGKTWGTDGEATIDLASAEPSLNKNVWSLDLSGNRIVVFCDGTDCSDTKNKKCQIIDKPDANLNDQWIGRCQSSFYNFWQKNEPCMECTSVRIFNK